MIAYILLIFLAWFVKMPLWLSIVTTVFAGLCTICKFIKFIVDCVKASD